MFSRPVNLILVFALIACPLGCFNGLCCTGRAILANSPPGASSPKRCCCCHDECPDESPVAPNHENQEELPCQGICGGAVLGKPVAITVTCIPVMDVVELAETQESLQPENLGIDILDSHSQSGKNLGRLLRARLSSFLC